MELFPYEIQEQLQANGHLYEVEKVDDLDLKPVVTITGGRGWVWLLTRSGLHYPDTLFGLCDLAAGQPELGYVNREWMEVAELENPHGVMEPLRRDEDFHAEFPLGVYKLAAENANRIIANNIAYLQEVEEYARSLAAS